MEQFILMLCGHALADYPLQGDFVSKFKSINSGSEMWPYVLVSHGLIHGLMVYAVTHSLTCLIGETAIHALTDHLKCTGRISFHTDQWIHIFSKALWVMCV